MIIFDTNVLSELIRATPDPNVLAWTDLHSYEEVCISSITVAELLAGVARMPDGRKKTIVVAGVAQMLEEDFRGRILPFDEAAALSYAELTARREQRGVTKGMADSMIAATAESAGAELIVTRNVTDFSDIGVGVLNPWVN